MKPIERIWKDPERIEVPPQFQEAVGGHPLVAQTLLSRGITTIPEALAYLNPDLYVPTPGTTLPDLEQAAARIEQAIRASERIGVWGDFDADGQTATTVLVSGLRKLGADVVYHIPVRREESHGINLPNLQKMIDSGVQLILTCDTGITAHEAVNYAKNKGVPVIITDHHTLPPTLPDAFAVVNSQRLPVGHPLNPLCGVGCAFKIIEELFIRHAIPEEASSFLDLVAIGTVADLAPLTGDNRYLVQRGLQQLRAAPRLAIQAVLETAGMGHQNLSEEHISFVIAPRMNALGRLEDANPMVTFLLTESEEEAKVWASRLDGLNNERKEKSDQVFAAAVSQVQREPALLDTSALVLAHPTWPGGIVGIVASRLVERYQRPTVLLSAPEGGTARGSARSIEGINITAAIAENAKLLRGFGGHPMAAGLSLPAEDIPRFRKALGRTIDRMIAKKPLHTELIINASLALEEISLDLVKDLERLAPFGPGNPSLVFASRNLVLSGTSHIGKNSEHLKLIVRDPADVEKTVLWWRGADQILPEGKFDLAYSIRASSYEGREEVTIEWIDAREIAPQKEEISTRSRLRVHDLRDTSAPLMELKRLFQERQPLIWAEGQNDLKVETINRMQLSPHPLLVLWNIPPGPQELREILEAVSPQEIFVFGTPIAAADPTAFVREIASMISSAIDSTGGRIDPKKLAARTGHRNITVQKAIDLLAAAGKIEVQPLENKFLKIQRCSNAPKVEKQKMIQLALNNLFRETLEFQKWFKKSRLDLLFNSIEKSK